MAYRRRQQLQLGRTASPHSYIYDFAHRPDGDASTSSSSSSPFASSLTTKAVRASAAYMDSSLSSTYEHSAVSSPRDSSTKDPVLYEFTEKKMNESKQGFWGVLAQKAKAILEYDDNGAEPHEMPEGTRLWTSDRIKKSQHNNTYNSSESQRKTNSSSIMKGLGAIASSLNHIGGTIGNAVEEGITAVENRTAEVIQETRKIQLRKKSGSSISHSQDSNLGSLRQRLMQTRMPPRSQIHTDPEMQLKASRDISMAMAAKAKLLLRELKTVKTDLAFAKERCGQLEEENRMFRESREGHSLEDDDLVRLQLETLLTEKSRLAQENSVYARENRFLREVVEYHQLTMQDVLYFDEGNIKERGYSS